MGVQVRTSWRQRHWIDALVLQYLLESWAELAVAIHDQITLTIQESVLEIRQFASRLFHPGGVRIGRATGEGERDE